MVAAVIQCSRVAESEPAAIASALRKRDADFIARLVSQYHYRLVRYLVYLTARRESAEDLVQDTWIRVLERAAQYNGRGRFEPWLFSIARNLAFDYLRREQSSDATLDDAAAAAVDSPFQAAARSEDAARIASALSGLPPLYREALLLRFQEELSLEEVAQVVGAPVSTVSSRIQRGLAQLRAQFEEGAHAG